MVAPADRRLAQPSTAVTVAVRRLDVLAAILRDRGAVAEAVAAENIAALLRQPRRRRAA